MTSEEEGMRSREGGRGEEGNGERGEGEEGELGKGKKLNKGREGVKLMI